MKFKSVWWLPVLFPAVLFTTFQLAYWNRAYPGLTSYGQAVGNKTQDQIVTILSSQVPHVKTVNLVWGTSQWTISSDQVGLHYDLEQTAHEAVAFGRTGTVWNNLVVQVQAFSQGFEVPIVFSVEENLLAERVSHISTEIDVPAREPEVTLEKGVVVVNTGENGQRIDDRLLRDRIRAAFATNSTATVEIPVVAINPQISAEQASVLEARAHKLIGKKMTLKFEHQTWEIDSAQIINWLDASNQAWKTLALESWIVGLADSVNRAADNALFNYQNGKVIEFKPATSGIVVDQDKLLAELQTNLGKLETDTTEVVLEVPFAATQPTIKTADVNDLGIKEIIGRGESDYTGSIVNRIFNLSKAAANMHGVLIAPQEVFSFNKYVGDISLAGGYKQAYIIKDGKTILGDGGGVCQVSTTMFRAALNAGLPIEERTAHAYRVHYYENDSLPGVDATIFTPTTDFKFKNDTPGYILIQMKLDTTRRKLVFELYGTSDGRVAEVSKPKVWDITPPPPDLYQDDPTLARGVVKQVDWKAPGTKASFTYKVTRNGEVLQDRTFYSNYRPWQAIYLRGTL